MADARAKTLLQQRDGAQRRYDLVGLGRARAAGGDLRERLAMHAAVLADLQVREVKAERLRLPDELVHLAIRLARSARGDERILQRPKVVEQLIRSRVGEGEIRAAGRRDALGDEQEELTVRLAWGARLDGVGAIPDDRARRTQGG